MLGEWMLASKTRHAGESSLRSESRVEQIQEQMRRTCLGPEKKDEPARQIEKVWTGQTVTGQS